MNNNTNTLPTSEILAYAIRHIERELEPWVDKGQAAWHDAEHIELQNKYNTLRTMYFNATGETWKIA